MIRIVKQPQNKQTKKIKRPFFMISTHKTTVNKEGKKRSKQQKLEVEMRICLFFQGNFPRLWSFILSLSLSLITLHKLNKPTVSASANTPHTQSGKVPQGQKPKEK